MEVRARRDGVWSWVGFVRRVSRTWVPTNPVATSLGCVVVGRFLGRQLAGIVTPLVRFVVKKELRLYI